MMIPKHQVTPIHDYFLSSLDSPANYRREVFDAALKHCPPRPRILEIGGARSLSRFARMSDGWSSLHWLLCTDAVRLTVCDTSWEAVQTTSQLLAPCSDMGELLSDNPVIRIKEKDGLHELATDSDYDLVYLDGSDDPIQMKDQFDWCDKSRQVIVCDDFHIKGKHIREAYPEVVANHDVCTIYGRVFALHGFREHRQMAVFVPHELKYPLG